MIGKYLAGSITPATIEANEYTWAAHWLLKARKAENQGNELIVLEVPKTDLSGVMGDDESLEIFLRLDVG